jgi:hypothetical protein
MLNLACKKGINYTPVLPQQSSYGQNSLGFLYNNAQVWTSIEHGIFFLYNEPDDIPNATCTVLKETNGKKSVTLLGRMKIKDRNAVVVNNSVFVIDLYMVDLAARSYFFDTTRLGNHVMYEDHLANTIYSSYTNNSFQFSITQLDTVQQLISGTFSGTLYKMNGSSFLLNAPMTVQSGRFDIKYTTY